MLVSVVSRRVTAMPDVLTRQFMQSGRFAIRVRTTVDDIGEWGHLIVVTQSRAIGHRALQPTRRQRAAAGR